MSQLWSPFAYDVGGAPHAAAATPELRAYGQLTAVQAAAAQDVFARFCQTARNSMVPNPTEWGNLPDGTPYRIDRIGVQTIMQVWPDAAPSEVIRSGFLLQHYGAVPAKANYLLDVEVKDGKHTGKWKARPVSTEEAATLHANLRSRNLCPAMKGPGALPYSVDGYTYGKKLFSVEVPGTGFYEHPIVLEGARLYSYRLPTTQGLILTETMLNKQPTLGGTLPTKVSHTSVTIAPRIDVYEPHISASYTGREIVVQVDNSWYSDGIVSSDGKFVFADNPGPSYGYGYTPTEIRFPTKTEGPMTFERFTRNGLELVRTQRMRPDDATVTPARAIYKLVRMGPPLAARALESSGINVVRTGAPTYRVAWSTSGLEYMPYAPPSGSGEWVGDTTVTWSSAGPARGTYSHRRHYYLCPPRFSMQGALTDYLLTEEFSYQLDTASDQTTTVSGRAMVGDAPQSSPNDPAPTPSGDVASYTPIGPGKVSMRTGSYVTSGTSTTTETSSCRVTGEVLGKPMVFSDCSAVVVVAQTRDLLQENVGYLGPGSYEHYNEQATVTSRYFMRKVYLVDPDLQLLCYMERTSELNYTISSGRSFTECYWSGPMGYIYGNVQYTASAGPQKSAQRQSVKLIIEHKGVVVRSYDAKDETEVHPMFPRFRFGAPALQTTEQADSRSIEPPVFSYEGTAPDSGGMVAVVTGSNTCGGMGNYLGSLYGASGDTAHFKQFGVDFHKSPATGAMLIVIDSLLLADDAAGQISLYVDALGVREESAVEAMAKIPSAAINQGLTL